MHQILQRSSHWEPNDVGAVLRALVDGSREIVSVLDANRTFVVFSQPYSDVFFEFWGMRPESGRTLDDLLKDHPAIFEAASRRWNRALAGERYIVQESFHFPTGKKRYYELEFKPIYNADDKLIGAVQSARDITDTVAREEAEGRYVKVRKRLDFLLNALPLPIWACDLKGEITFVNDRWREVYQTGVAAFETLRQILIHPDDQEAVASEWKACLRNRTTFSIRCRLFVAREGFRWNLLIATPEFVDGVLTEWIGANVDLHDQIEHERSLALIARVGQTLAKDLDLERIVQALIDASVEATGAKYGAFFHAVEGRDDTFELYTLSGAPKEAFTGLELPRAAHKLGRKGESGHRMICSSDVTVDPRFVTEDKRPWMPKGHLTIRSYLAMALASQSGKEIGLLVLGHPEPNRFMEKDERLITGFATQAAIAFDNARLYQDLSKLNEDLVAARDVALTSSRAKSEFLANMSHEIRTPLNGVLGMASLLREQPLTDEARDMVETVASSGETVLRVIGEVLDLARIDAGRMEIDRTTTDLSVLVADVVALYQGNARAKQLSLRAVPPTTPCPLVMADALRLRQILSNLVSNAVKFTHAGNVEVGWKGSLVDGRVHLRIWVSDTGIGIPQDRFASIFDSFTQADGSVQRQYGGSGLGLTIAQRLVQLMGGTISVESIAGKGSTFHIDLTCDSATVAASAPPSIQVDSFDGFRVLLAEDNPVNVMVAKRILETCGCEVMVAEDGLRAISLANDHRFDLVLMDLQMPFCDGLEATRVLRQTEEREHRPHLPIVALTANALETDRQASFAAGMDDFVPKPITLPALRQVLGRFHQAAVTVKADNHS